MVETPEPKENPNPEEPQENPQSSPHVPAPDTSPPEERTYDPDNVDDDTT